MGKEGGRETGGTYKPCARYEGEEGEEDVPAEEGEGVPG